MIVDTLDNTDLYPKLAEPDFAAAIAFLRSADAAAGESGSYPIDGERVYAIIQEYDTRSSEDVRWEAHRRYVDLQYVVSGTEAIYWSPVSTLTMGGVYDDANDATMFDDGGGSPIRMLPGSFVVLFPGDAHRPCCSVGEPEPVRKVVVKIRLPD